MSDELLTVAEVAAELKVNPETVRRWLRSQKLRGTLLGDRAGWRIPRSEVARFLIGPIRSGVPEDPNDISWHRSPIDDDPKVAA